MMSSGDLSADLDQNVLSSASSICSVEEHSPREDEDADAKARRHRARSEPETSNSDDSTAETGDENPHLLDRLA
jgi:hypothetical protein